MGKIKGIIFDMDNTILRSNIDFEGMKQETFLFLVSRGICSKELELANHTTATIIEKATSSSKMTKELLSEMWEIPRRFEVEGMKGAALEEGVVDTLDELQATCRLAVVTNNSIQAAERALMENNIYDYFTHIVGRETMGSLKPSPNGYNFVLNRCYDIPLEDWISVGDSWIDGAAASAAGVTFISYRGDLDKMNRMGVFPFATITSFREIKNYIVYN